MIQVSRTLVATLTTVTESALSVIENDVRIEITRACSESRQECEKAMKELHTAQLEIMAWKEESNSNKASVARAQMTITHQSETIAQLRRELKKTEDQARNWQDHFLRVEQERCALASRIDELTERLQPASGFITPKSRNIEVTRSAPSTVSKKTVNPSPTQPPAYKSAAPPSPQDIEAPANQPTQRNAAKTAAKSKAINVAKEEPPATPTVAHNLASQTQKPVSISNRQNIPQTTRSTVVRRVQAVIHVKKEESDNESSKEEDDDDEVIPRPTLRRRSRKAVVDDDWAPEDNEKLDDDDDDDDELMLGPEDNHDEIYAANLNTPSKSQRLRLPPTGPAKKKRKVDSR